MPVDKVERKNLILAAIQELYEDANTFALGAKGRKALEALDSAEDERQSYAFSFAELILEFTKDRPRDYFFWVDLLNFASFAYRDKNPILIQPIREALLIALKSKVKVEVKSLILGKLVSFGHSFSLEELNNEQEMKEEEYPSWADAAIKSGHFEKIREDIIEAFREGRILSFQHVYGHLFDWLPIIGKEALSKDMQKWEEAIVECLREEISGFLENNVG